jgi:hypothetical protein
MGRLQNTTQIWWLFHVCRCLRSSEIAVGSGMDDHSSITKRALSIPTPVLAAHRSCHPVGTGARSPGDKVAGAWSYLLSWASADVDKTWVYKTTPPYAFMLHSSVKREDNLAYISARHCGVVYRVAYYTVPSYELRLWNIYICICEVTECLLRVGNAVHKIWKKNWNVNEKGSTLKWRDEIAQHD